MENHPSGAEHKQMKNNRNEKPMLKIAQNIEQKLFGADEMKEKILKVYNLESR